jgi:hypothetical protein
MWSLWQGGEKICTKFKETIRDITSGEQLIQYWTAKDRFINAPFDVDWPITATIMKELPTSRRHWLTKSCANVAPTANNLFQRK